MPDTSAGEPKDVELPEPNQSPIPISEPNEPVTLYQGTADVQQGANHFVADIRVSLTWLPSPRIQVNIPAIPPGTPSIPNDFSVELSDGTPVRCHFSRLRTTVPQVEASLAGIVTERIVRSPGTAAKYAFFLVPNLKEPIGRPTKLPGGGWSATRSVLEGSGWTVTLDHVPSHKETIDRLENNSGFAVTQIGRLERTNGQPFSVDDATQILDALGSYISFACARWTGPVLVYGFGEHNQRVWETWDIARVVPYRYRLSWLDAIHQSHFEGAYRGFIKLWLDEYWREIVRG